MKKHKYILYILFIMLLSSCDTTSNLVEPEINQQRTSADYIAQIESMGFNIDGIEEGDGFFLIEGCIKLTENYLDEEIKHELAKTEQRKTYYLANWSNVNSIKIKIDSSMPTSGVDNWRPEISQAISAWNAISGSRINLQLVTSGQHITIRSDGGSLSYNVIASASFPNSAGAVGPTIDVNLDYLYNKTVPSAQKKWNIAHEIGHCLGFWHTQTSHGNSVGQNNYGGFTPQTLTTDNSSVMLAWSAESLGSTITSFSSNDQIAAKVLYPTSLTGTINNVTHQGYYVDGAYEERGTAYFSHNGLYSFAELYVGSGGNWYRLGGSNPNGSSSSSWVSADPFASDDRPIKIRLYNTRKDKWWDTNTYY